MKLLEASRSSRSFAQLRDSEWQDSGIATSSLLGKLSRLLSGVAAPATAFGFVGAPSGARMLARTIGELGRRSQGLQMQLETEVLRRRNLAIISHPDAGKTTLTEKLLLYGGAIQQAGAVKAKGDQRRATSDFMELEQERGISISSTVLMYEYQDKVVSILDTPGHQDFSEDTYRTLAAADNAVMLIDGAKGLEPQTRKLFEVAHLRRLPLFTFVNKLDRPSLSPYQVCDEIEAEFGIACSPVLWPIGSGDLFKGVLDLRTKLVHLFAKGVRGGKAEEYAPMKLEDPELKELIEDQELYDQLMEDAELVPEMLPVLDLEAVARGEQTPVFFGSAMSNFGVQLFLDAFMSFGSPPMPRAMDTNSGEFSSGATAEDAELVEPTSNSFSGFIFKLQANVNPKHRDRMAYVRICSGTFERGMKVKHSRIKGKEIALSSVQTLMGNERVSIDNNVKCYPGDVIGLSNPKDMAIGDTLYTGGKRISYTKIPSFSPEVFARCINTKTAQSKNFNKGIEQLLEEGAVQLLRNRGQERGGVPILAAVGQLQFEVVIARLAAEYNVEATLEPLAFTSARWALAGWEAVDEATKENKLLGVEKLMDAYNRPVLLFSSDWKRKAILEELGEKLQLRPFAVAPDVVKGKR